MGKYNLRFIKPLISLSLGAAIITSAIVGGAEDASAATNYKISNGILVFKATKKVVRGTVTYKGKVYKNGQLFTGAKGNTYYKNGKKATGIYKERYYLNGKIYSGIAKGIYYKNGVKSTGTYKGTYYLKGKAYTGLVVDIYYSNGKKANGTYEGVFYLNGTAFTGLHPNTGYLYINGALNTVLKVFEGNLYNGARLNEGVIQYNGLWYAGKTVANGTITIPGGQIIIVENGRQTGTINSGPGSYYSVINEAIAKLGALKFYEVYTINHVTNLVDARRQYNEAKVAVDVAVARGAVTSEFGVNYWRLAAQSREIDRYEGRDTKEVALNKATTELARLEYTAVNSIRSATNLTTAKYQDDAATTAVEAARTKGAITSDFGTIYWRLAAQKTEIDRYEGRDTKEVALNKATPELARLEYTAVNSIRYAANLTTAKYQYDAATTAVEAARTKGAITSDFGTNYWRLAAQKTEIDRYEGKESKEVAITKATTELGKLKFTDDESIKDSTSLTTAKSQYDAAKKAVEAAIAKGAVTSDFGSDYSKLAAQGKEINRYEEVKPTAIKDATTKLVALIFYTENSIDDATKLAIAQTQYNAAKTAVEAAIAKGAVTSDFGSDYPKLAAQGKEINRYEEVKPTAIKDATTKLVALIFYTENSIDDATKLAIAQTQYNAAKTAVEAAIAKGAVTSDFGSDYPKLAAQGKEINRYEEVKPTAIKDATTKLAALMFYKDNSIDDATKLATAQTQYNAAKTAVEAAIAKGATEADFANLANLAAQKTEIDRYKAQAEAEKAEAEATAAAKSFREAHEKALTLTVENVGVKNEAEVKAALSAYDKLSKAAQGKVSDGKDHLDKLSEIITKLIEDIKVQNIANEVITALEKINWKDAKKEMVEYGMTETKEAQWHISNIKDAVVKVAYQNRLDIVEAAILAREEAISREIKVVKTGVKDI
ncbi:hypothetical protein JFL43_07715 [Viridibacillus sp. YIM B01967]|uniref:Uncharacterized protein n=1 Tax=Viridibacillus soli TaxID=2798301 RepID=A0ABS1H620_9BACL|nr:hypothetical protein [Viridibacillus soli]MBK3494744.1 hypothetical protein [Viridibacillus soli]